LNTSSKLWLGAVGGLLTTFVLVALALPRSFRLTASSDIIQCLLLVSGVASLLLLTLRSQGRTRLFWALNSLGIGFWLSYQIFWTYYEVGLKQDVPDLCAWDIVLFLHIVPLMAALALRPHMPRDEYAARVGRLDLMLLLGWWFYLYVLIVMPWQYVVPDIAAYNHKLDQVYNAEKIVLLTSLLACWITSKGAWKKLYAALFAVNLCYAASSTLANWAIAGKSYYSGSFYDIPLVVAMAGFTWIGLTAQAKETQVEPSEASSVYGVWVTRFSMIAVLSIPLFAAWAISEREIPDRIRMFRLALTFLASLFMGVMVLARQRRLDRELVHLLNHSQESFDNLKRLQTQIIHSEKLASIGQLVGGATHELNNPITAMLGYSDLLLGTPLTVEQQLLAERIGQHARRTKTLVASLISFARQTPAPKTSVDLNSLARTALKLTQSQWETLGIEIRMQFDSTLPKVLGDSNQLLQVCLQLIAKCLHVLKDQGGKILTVSTHGQPGTSVVLEIAAEPLSRTPEASSRLSGSGDSEHAFGLSACQGILQEHRGQISQVCHETGRLMLRVELPSTDSSSSQPMGTMMPGLLQSPPYA
jgi:signal transduction histidine kinase